MRTVNIPESLLVHKMPLSGWRLMTSLYKLDGEPVTQEALARMMGKCVATVRDRLSEAIDARWVCARKCKLLPGFGKGCEPSSYTLNWPVIDSADESPFGCPGLRIITKGGRTINGAAGHICHPLPAERPFDGPQW